MKIEKCKGYECFECLDDYIEHLRHKIDELIESMYKDNFYIMQKIERAIEYIEDTCYYSELNNYSNMTDNEVKELLKILKGD